jgi:hypothetical protein
MVKDNVTESLTTNFSITLKFSSSAYFLPSFLGAEKVSNNLVSVRGHGSVGLY